MKFKFTYFFFLAFLLIASSTKVSKGAIVVPNAYSGTPGTATFLGPLANAQRTYQLLINQSELVPLVGDLIESITFRLPVSATADWPASDAVFSNYDIYLSGSVALNFCKQCCRYSKKSKIRKSDHSNEFIHLRIKS